MLYKGVRDYFEEGCWLHVAPFSTLRFLTSSRGEVLRPVARQELKERRWRVDHRRRHAIVGRTFAIVEHHAPRVVLSRSEVGRVERRLRRVANPHHDSIQCPPVGDGAKRRESTLVLREQQCQRALHEQAFHGAIHTHHEVEHHGVETPIQIALHNVVEFKLVSVVRVSRNVQLQQVVV